METEPTQQTIDQEGAVVDSALSHLRQPRSRLNPRHVVQLAGELGVHPFVAITLIDAARQAEQAQLSRVGNPVIEPASHPGRH